MKGCVLRRDTGFLPCFVLFRPIRKRPMTLLAKLKTRSAGTTAFAGVAALATLATANYLVARNTERRHPPKGLFITVDGVRLQYSDRGEGSPVVLIHGNAVTGDDWNTSGVAEL